MPSEIVPRLSVLPSLRRESGFRGRTALRGLPRAERGEVRDLVPFVRSYSLVREKKNKGWGSVWKPVLRLFQGAVDAFWASTAPSVSAEGSVLRYDRVELGHLAESAIRDQRGELAAETFPSAMWMWSKI